MSYTISSVTNAFIKYFVPNFIGFNHKSRDELLQQHQTHDFKRLLNGFNGDLILILDGTYLYTEKPTDLITQTLLYSGQKKRHLLKPMMVVTTTGYIIEAKGLFGGNGENNDASILSSIISKDILSKKILLSF